jgi:hypothetical protein
MPNLALRAFRRKIGGMNAMSRKILLPLPILMALVACASTLTSIGYLQSDLLPVGSLSTIEGLVQDPSGDRLGGAVVTIQAKGTKTSAVVATDAQGHFAFDELAAGEYEIDIKHDKSGAKIRHFIVSARTAIHITIRTSTAFNLKSTTSGVEVREGKDRLKEVHNM